MLSMVIVWPVAVLWIIFGEFQGEWTVPPSHLVYWGTLPPWLAEEVSTKSRKLNKEILYMPRIEDL